MKGSLRGGMVWYCAGGGGSRAGYLAVYVVYQKKTADYIYPMGIGRWNPTSCSSSDVALGIRKTTEGVYSRQTQMRM